MSNTESNPLTDYRTFDKLNHANYHSWAPRAKAKLMELGVWRFCTGEELALPKPVLPTVPKEGTNELYQKQLKEYQEDVRYYNEHQRRNDRAVGAINLLIEPDQFEYTKDLTTAQEVWEKLKEKHANVHTRLAAFYTKMGILKKKYTEGEDLHAHFSHILMENRKLQKKGFDDEFLAQILLMSLPQDNTTWSTLIVTLIQATMDSNPLKSEDVVQ